MKMILETLQDFYTGKKIDPAIGDDRIGHFNVFRLDPFVGPNAQPVPYRIRNYFKITLVEGKGKLIYADREITVENYALVFSNPQVPYRWEQRDQITSGFFCIFDQDFFFNYGNLAQYPVFQPQCNHVFELNKEQAAAIKLVYQRMFVEIASDYVYRFDVLRTAVYEMVHFAQKTQPSLKLAKNPINASQRIEGLFMELLERQFPIDERHGLIKLRGPSNFAEKLNIHVNHLNKAVKEVSGKTTSEIIAERLIRESQLLLKLRKLTISEISRMLGFSELTHFGNFFKKHVRVSPKRFRDSC